MGYYTMFRLTTKRNKYKLMDIVAYMQEQYEDSDKFYPFADEFSDYLRDDSLIGFELGFSDMVKWYEHDEDMRELSKRFPETVFCLHGEGEESGDLWRTYYKNGKAQECNAKIVYDDYDENKLV